MKLLFDEDVSHQLAALLADLFPGSSHVLLEGLGGTSDLAVRKFAAANNFTIVTRDTDHRNLSFYYGAPPKIVWLCMSRPNTKRIEAAIRAKLSEILVFINDPTSAFLVLSG